jgi:hypothetical protein
MLAFQLVSQVAQDVFTCCHEDAKFAISKSVLLAIPGLSLPSAHITSLMSSCTYAKFASFNFEHTSTIR